MHIKDCYYLGYISKVYKDKFLVVKPDVDDLSYYLNLESMLIQMNKSDDMLVPFFLSTLQIQNNTFVIEMDSDIGVLKSYIGKTVYLPLDKLKKMTGTKFYYHEVVGFKVIDKEKGELGVLKEVLDYPHQAILSIYNQQNTEILIPITDNSILGIDRDKKELHTDAPEGLVDFYRQESAN